MLKAATSPSASSANQNFLIAPSSLLQDEVPGAVKAPGTFLVLVAQKNRVRLA